MSLFKDLKGIIGSIFQFGKGSGSIIKDNSGVVEIKNSADNAYSKLRALRIQVSNSIDDVPTLLDAMNVVIQFSFAGASAPAAGANTGKFGFCHTTGGSYTQNDVVYDDGSSLIKLPREVCKLIITSSIITGTVSMNANGVYAWEGSSYILKGDGSGGTDVGKLMAIELSITNSSGNVDSTTSIPSGARVVRVICDVQTGFNGTAPTVEVKVNGSTPLTIMATTDNNLKVVNQYEVEEFVEVGASNTGVIRAAVVPDSSATGAAKILVLYVSPNA